MLVNEIMTREVYTCRPDDTLGHAAQIMWDQDIGCVPVVDEKRRVVGMLTDRDICMAAYTKGRPLAWIPVRCVMARSVFACTPDTPVETVIVEMAVREVHRVPVVEDGVLVGIIAMNDVVRAANDLSPDRESVVDALATIARPRRELLVARSVA